MEGVFIGGGAVMLSCDDFWCLLMLKPSGKLSDNTKLLITFLINKNTCSLNPNREESFTNQFQNNNDSQLKMNKFKLKELKTIGDTGLSVMRKDGKWKCLVCDYEMKRT